MTGSFSSPRIAHAYDGSMLYRGVTDNGYAFDQFAQELYGPELLGYLKVGGYLETRQTVDPIHLSPGFGMESPAFRSLIGKPFDKAYVSLSEKVDSFDRKLEGFSIVLRSSYQTGFAELSFSGDEFHLLAGSSADNEQSSEPLLIDDLAARDIIKDILIQSGKDPRELNDKTTPATMLTELTSKTTNLTVQRQTDHKWDNFETTGTSVEINFDQTTKLKRLKSYSGSETNIQRTALLGVTSLSTLSQTEPLISRSPFAVTRLHFANSRSGNRGTIQAAIGNVTPRLYDMDRRNTLLEGTYTQLGEPGAFTGRLTTALSKLATFDIIDLSTLA